MLTRLMFVHIFAVLMGLACQKEQPTRKISDAINDFSIKTEGKTELDLLVLLPNDLDQDKIISGKEAGLLTTISDSKRLYRLKGPKELLKDLDIVANAKLSFNDEIKFRSIQPFDSTSKQAAIQDLSALDLLTVRNVVGVDDLLERFPEADGRGIKVAVFDTGIDFGISGLSSSENEHKLQGFYDLTNFGEVKLEPVFDDLAQLPISFAKKLAPKKILAKGVLSEAQLAKDYLVPEGLDLNGNGSKTDVYHFVLGIGEDGQYGIWIDLDGNGIVEDPTTEYLKDFNTSNLYINMVKRGEQRGTHALAVSIHSEEKVQFHRVLHGHGTACALIIGGDGYGNGAALKGLAPKARFVSYTLDVTGQDIYTMDQFMEMFLHAKKQKVDAISISWGFSTSNLSSARFFADFLDQEVASQGILIAIAAGNNGPGVSSGPSDDYIPHHGFGVGAMISQKQANNVYGWTGANRDAVVDYSSFGPTRGGRQIPDVISPIVSLVRGVRGSDSDPFYGFSGTSSATPALVGASAALMSVLKKHGPINMRLFKLALQNSSRLLPDTLEIRQGSGLYNIEKAHDIYLNLSREWNLANSDPSKQNSFAYELKAKVKLGRVNQDQEGIYTFGLPSSQLLSISLSDESKALIDPLYFYEPLLLKHQQDFFEVPDILNLQASGAQFQLKFNRDKLLDRSGVFSDIISIVRPSDGLELLRIPIVLQLSGKKTHGRTLADVDARMHEFDIWRMPIKLESPSSISFDGLVSAKSGFEGARIYIYIRSEEGHVSASHRIGLYGALTSVNFQSTLLPKGHYELLISRNYGRPAVLSPIQIFGSFTKPKLKVVESEINKEKQSVMILIEAFERTKWTKASLRIEGQRYNFDLRKNVLNGQLAFQGAIKLANSSNKIKIGLSQSRLYRNFNTMLHMNVAMLESETMTPLYRGWVDVQDHGSVLQSADLSSASAEFNVIAYPNIVNWEKLDDTGITMEIEQDYTDDLKKKAYFEQEYQLEQGEKTVLTFESLEANSGEYGYLELENQNSGVKISIPLRL